MLSSVRRFTVPVVIAVAAATAATCTMAQASQARPTAERTASTAHYAHPPTPKAIDAIEDFAAYQPQFICRNKVGKGVKSFEKMTLKAYPATTSLGDMRSCAEAGTSEHKDGRAFDWGADHRIAKQRKAGKAMLKWLFASDSAGNPYAMVRRLGIMYIIWNHRIWGSWNQQWDHYSCGGDPTSCHVNHMHFSFGWAGAEKKTSYWTGKASPTLEPPLPVFGKAGAHKSLTVAATSGSTGAMWLLKGGLTYAVRVTGVWHHGHGKKAVSDGVCTRTKHGWQPSDRTAAGVSGDTLQSWGERWTAVKDTGNGCNTATHAYRLTLTPALGSTVIANLNDDSRGDDSGSLHYRFTRLG